MDEFSQQNKELQKTIDSLHKKFKKQGLNSQQIEFKMLQLDVDFLLHSFMNGTLLHQASIKKRLEFYTRTLKMWHSTV